MAYFDKSLLEDIDYNKQLNTDYSFELMNTMIRAFTQKQIDFGLNDYKSFTYEPLPLIKETDEEIVIKLLKGDFKKQCGIDFEKFIEVYNDIIENHPEKLI